MRVRILDGPCAAGLMLLGVLSPGCEWTPESLDEQWSTKQQSVLGKDEIPRLHIPTPYEPEATVEVRAASLDLLGQAVNSTNPLLRANALEALITSPDDLEPILRVTLADENRGVRFTAAMIVGKVNRRGLVDAVRPLLGDPSESVRAAAIFALRSNGESVDPTPLSRFLASEDPEIRANAAMVLGYLGDPSALPMLREAVKHRLSRVPTSRARVVDLQIAEAMVRLGADAEIEVIRAAVFAPAEQAELTVLATQILGELGDQVYAPALLDKAMREGREQEPPEVRLAAAQAVARIDPGRAPIRLPLQYLDDPDFRVRSFAATTLGWMGDPVTLPRLAARLEDSNALVQVSAAGAILRLTAGTSVALRPADAGGTAAMFDTNLTRR